jgi:large subunit ribosomal protein L9
MDIILLEKIRNLGDLGDQVSVRPGYGRNYLIPQGKAARATAENKAIFEARRAELEKVQTQALGSAQARGEKMAGYTVQIVRKAGEEGRLFGSVGTGDIAEAMTAADFELSKSEVLLPMGALKEMGDHEVTIALHPEVSVKIIVSIVAEK